MLTAYNWTTIPIHNTFLGAQHSMDEVTRSRSNPPDGSFLGKNSGRPCRVPFSLVLICLVLGPLLQESLSKGRGLQC